jgi:hypothetical protein
MDNEILFSPFTLKNFKLENRIGDDCFRHLPDYPFEPNYVEVPKIKGGGIRIHYIDEGPKEANSVLLMHGEPSWSYIYTVRCNHRL